MHEACHIGPGTGGRPSGSIPPVTAEPSGLCGAVSPPTPGAATGYDGRVEHLVSGQVARFYALEALPAFMTWALADMLCTPTQGGQRPRAVEAVALAGTTISGS